MKRRTSRYQDPDGVVHISIGYNHNKSAMHCETGGLADFKWPEKDLVLTDEPPTCLECTRKTL